MNLICEALFVYRYLPIDEKLNLHLCALRASVVNPGRLRRRQRFTCLWQAGKPSRGG